MESSIAFVAPADIDFGPDIAVPEVGGTHEFGESAGGTYVVFTARVVDVVTG